MIFTDIEKRITPENITELKPNEVFVFGSNESGRHGAGTALLAKQKFGAIQGNGYGPMGQSFAIPTKSWDVKGIIPLNALKCYIGRFAEYVEQNPKKHFLITKVGCGLAGWGVEDIAPLFAGFDNKMYSNVSLPQEFWDIISRETDNDLAEFFSLDLDEVPNDKPEQ